MVSHQLVHGLADTEIQEQVLTHAATNTYLDLASITKLIEAKETGKRFTAQITLVRLNKLSDHRIHDRAHPLPKAGADLVPEGKCGFCNTWVTAGGRAGRPGGQVQSLQSHV